MSYRKRNDLAMRFLPEPTEIAYSLAETNLDDQEGEDIADEENFAQMANLRNYLQGAQAEGGWDALDSQPGFQAMLEEAHLNDTEEAQKVLADPEFPVWFARFRSNLPENGESADRLLERYPGLVAHFWKAIRRQSDKMKREVLGHIDWKFVYIALSRTLTVHEELEYAGVITTTQLTAHTPIVGGDRKRLFFSLQEAISASLPGDVIYLHSSQEEKLYPDTLRERNIIYRGVNRQFLEPIGEAVQTGALDTPLELGGVVATARQALARLTAQDPDYTPPAPNSRVKVTVPPLVVTTPYLRIFGRGGGQIVDEAGAGIMMPLIWLAPGGVIATVDCVRGGLHIGPNADLTCLDVNFEVPINLTKKATLTCKECNILSMPGDVSWLTVPHETLDWHISLDRADVDAYLAPETLIRLVAKFLTPPIAYGPRPAAQALAALRPYTKSTFDSVADLHLQEMASHFPSSDPNSHNLVEDFSTAQREAYVLATTGPKSVELRRTHVFTAITTLLEQGVFDDPDVDRELGNFVRIHLLKWLPVFADNLEIVTNSLNALRSIPEDRMLKLIEDLNLMDQLPGLLERYINVDAITFALANVITKVCWSSDVHAINLGISDVIWKYIDVMIGKVMGVIAADASEFLGKPPGFYIPNPSKNPAQDAAASNQQNLASSASMLQNLSLSESIEIPKPVAKPFVRADSYRASAAVITLSNMLWSLSSYPQPGTKVMEHTMSFMMWAGKEFPQDSSIIENVCGIGQALLDCLPFQDTSRPDAAKSMIEAGAMTIILGAFKNQRGAVINADYWGHLLFKLCPDLAFETFMKADGLNVTLTALKHRVNAKFKTQQSIDFLTIMTNLVSFDEVWQRVKRDLEDMMFTMSTREKQQPHIIVLARCVATSPLRRLDLAHSGYLNYVLSETFTGYQSVATVLDTIDSLARDPAVLRAKASELRECAVHMQSFVEEDDSRGWINTVLDVTKPILTPEAKPTEHLPMRLVPILDASSSPHEVKITSDGMTCHVVEHCFHSFKLDFGGQYLKSGMWMYEVNLNSDGPMQIGWATKDFHPSVLENLGVGDDSNSWGGDFNRLILWHPGIEGGASNFRCLDPDAQTWNRGSLLTCAVDLDARIMYWSLDGGSPVQLSFPDHVEGLVPALTLARGESVTLNLGQHPFFDYHSFRDFLPITAPILGSAKPSPEAIQARHEYIERRLELAAAGQFAMGNAMFGGDFPDFEEFDEDDDDDELGEGFGEEDEEGEEDEDEEDEEGEEDEEDDEPDQAPVRRNVANRYAFGRR